MPVSDSEALRIVTRLSPEGRKSGAPDRIRTCGLRLRRPSLYPAELRARGKKLESYQIARFYLMLLATERRIHTLAPSHAPATIHQNRIINAASP